MFDLEVYQFSLTSMFSTLSLCFCQYLCSINPEDLQLYPEITVQRGLFHLPSDRKTLQNSDFLL